MALVVVGAEDVGGQDRAVPHAAWDVPLHHDPSHRAGPYAVAAPALRLCCHDAMQRSDVDRWLAGYVEAWRTYDREQIAALFGADAEYRYHPHDEPIRGRDAIVRSWLGESSAIRIGALASRGARGDGTRSAGVRGERVEHATIKAANAIALRFTVRTSWRWGEPGSGGEWVVEVGSDNLYDLAAEIVVLVDTRDLHMPRGCHFPLPTSHVPLGSRHRSRTPARSRVPRRHHHRCDRRSRAPFSRRGARTDPPKSVAAPR